MEDPHQDMIMQQIIIITKFKVMERKYICADMVEKLMNRTEPEILGKND